MKRKRQSTDTPTKRESSGSAIEKDDAPEGLSDFNKQFKTLINKLGLQSVLFDKDEKGKSLYPSPFIDPSSVRKLNDAQKEKLVQVLAELSHKVALTASNLANKVFSAPHMQIKDLEVNKNLSVDQQYQDVGLWRTIMAYNAKLAAKVQKLEKDTIKQMEAHMSAAKKVKTAEAPENEITPADDASQTEKDFSYFYMASMYGQFEKEIKKIHSEEGFNATKLSQLVDCLEAGIDIIPVDDHALFQSTGSQTSVAAVGLETATADAMEVEASPESTTTPSKNDKKKAKSPRTTPAKSPGKTPSKSPGKAK